MPQATKPVRNNPMSDYQKGREDRRDGHLPLDGMTNDYYEGYAKEYEIEQQEDARTSWLNVWQKYSKH